MKNRESWLLTLLRLTHRYGTDPALKARVGGDRVRHGEGEAGSYLGAWR